MTDTHTIQSVAKDTQQYFERTTRGEDRITVFTDSRPEWLFDAVYSAHGEGRGCRMKTLNPDPSLELASRIYAYRETGETWSEAVDAFARAVLMRHPRTVHRWLAGESPIPKAVAAWIMDGTPKHTYAELDAYENSVAPCDHD